MQRRSVGSTLVRVMDCVAVVFGVPQRVPVDAGSLIRGGVTSCHHPTDNRQDRTRGTPRVAKTRGTPRVRCVNSLQTVSNRTGLVCTCIVSPFSPALVRLMALHEWSCSGRLASVPFTATDSPTTLRLHISCPEHTVQYKFRAATTAAQLWRVGVRTSQHNVSRFLIVSVCRWLLRCRYRENRHNSRWSTCGGWTRPERERILACCVALGSEELMIFVLLLCATSIFPY